jgi:hypothetical protein
VYSSREAVVENVTIRGGAELVARLTALGDPARVGRAVGAALYQEAERVMADSKEHFVPVDLGELRASGHVREPQVSGAKASVQMGFGGPAAPYALRQHEELGYHHEVGEAKYLEKPLLAATDGLAARLGARIRRELGL